MYNDDDIDDNYCSINRSKTKIIIPNEDLLTNIGYGAIYAGNIELLSILNEKHILKTTHSYYFAGRANRPIVTKWLHDNFIYQQFYYEHSPHVTECCGAADGGHFELLKTLHQKNNNLPRDISTYAARRGHLDILKWLWQLGYIITDYAIEPDIIRNNHLETLSWLIDHGVQIPNKNKAHILAIAYGHLEILKLLVGIGHTCTSHSFSLATKFNRFDIVKYLHEIKCNYNSAVYINVADNGNLEMLKWLRENGYEWNNTLCGRLVNIGNLELLLWAINNNAPYTPRIKNLVDNICDLQAAYVNGARKIRYRADKTYVCK